MGVKGKSGPPGNSNAMTHGGTSLKILRELLALPAGAEDLREGIELLHDTLLSDFGGESANAIDKALVSLATGLVKQTLLLSRSIITQGGGIDAKSFPHLLDAYGRAQRALIDLQRAAKARPKDEGDSDERPLDAAGLKSFYRERGLI